VKYWSGAVVFRSTPESGLMSDITHDRFGPKAEIVVVCFCLGVDKLFLWKTTIRTSGFPGSARYLGLFGRLASSHC
jgi:hypothetical protein